jgi:ferrochelatase
MRLIVNFGGPRDLAEIEPFLVALLLDRDVLRTPFPSFLHDPFFRRIAKKRAKKIEEDYRLIGGRSPIYFDTEAIAKSLDAITFHRYLPATHAQTLAAIDATSDPVITVLPLFPQFSYATTGSIARFFQTHLSPSTVAKLRWIKSYPDSAPFIDTFALQIAAFLHSRHLPQEEVLLFFSAHGLPQAFVQEGDPYQTECERSYRALTAHFPKAASLLAYQSKFGRGEWLRPYTSEASCNLGRFNRPHVVYIPLSFTSDHIETLFEIEHQYLPLARAQGLIAHRCPALGREPSWCSRLETLFSTPLTHSNISLVRA